MTTTTTTAPPEAAASNRLSEAVRGLGTRAKAGDAERVLRLAGPVLLPTGAIVILLGWYGAANTTRVFLQIPYLISGGVLGLGMMFAGGFLYFGRWLTDLLDENRRSAASAHDAAERTAEALERIEALLRDRPLTTTVADAPVESVGVAPGVAPTGLVATEKGSMVHRPDCRLVEGRSVRAVGSGQQLRRCQVCRPPLG